MPTPSSWATSYRLVRSSRADCARRTTAGEAMHQDLKTYGRARLSFALEADIDEFSSMLDKFERGVITPDQWRMFRLVRGAYGQRQTDDSSMLRIKIPQGWVTADQLDAF